MLPLQRFGAFDTGWSDRQTVGPNMFRAIKRVRIHEEVVNQIHDLIKDGRFKAGDQLPSERELAEIFKVSRTSVREALRALETQGLVISRTGAGNYEPLCFKGTKRLAHRSSADFENFSEFAL